MSLIVFSPIVMTSIFLVFCLTVKRSQLLCHNCNMVIVSKSIALSEWIWILDDNGCLGEIMNKIIFSAFHLSFFRVFLMFGRCRFAPCGTISFQIFGGAYLIIIIIISDVNNVDKEFFGIYHPSLCSIVTDFSFLNSTVSTTDSVPSFFILHHHWSF